MWKKNKKKIWSGMFIFLGTATIFAAVGAMNHFITIENVIAGYAKKVAQVEQQIAASPRPSTPLEQLWQEESKNCLATAKLIIEMLPKMNDVSRRKMAFWMFDRNIEQIEANLGKAQEIQEAGVMK